MSIPRLEPELLDHLRVEFREHGSRATTFLETAWQLLDTELAPGPRLGELVAYCTREALTEIPKSSGIPENRRWEELSQEVVRSAQRYRMVSELPDESGTRALDELLASVDNLKRFHQEGQKVHQARLIALVIQRAGVEPLSSGTTPVLAYQGLLDRLNVALHTSCTVDDARWFWLETVALLRQLFLLPEVRNRELDKIALRHDPSASDMTDVLDMAGTSVHLRRFLDKVESPRWLWLFGDSGVLDSGAGELWWSACSAAVRLADTHRDDVLVWLREMYDKHTSELERVRPIAHAAYRLGGSGLDLLLDIVRRYPEDERIVFTGRDAALELDASDRMVEHLADVLMNQAGWDSMIAPERLAGHLVSGINEENALRRIERLCQKLSRVSEDDRILTQFRYHRSGLIAREHSTFPHDRSAVLLRSLTGAVRAALEWLPSADLLAKTNILPEPLRDRLRAWILAHAPDADPHTIATELKRAMASRSATGDDVALADRAIQVCDHTLLSELCRISLGDAPTVGEVSRALGSDQPLHRRWMRARSWVALLPDDLAESWIGPCHVLAGRFGKLRRDDLLRGRRVEAVWAESPISSEDLKTMPSEQAAEMIADWRPGPTDWPAGTRELARTLEALAKDDPEAWASDPVKIATKLRHPTYINHYLQALAELAGDMTLCVDGLLSVIQMVLAEPWPAVPLGRDQLDYDSDWGEAQRSAINLIEGLSRADADFGDRADDAWEVIETAARNVSEHSWGSKDMVPFDRAFNRPCTRALETAIHFVAAELRASRPMRPAFLDLLDFCLQLEGSDGEEYRAILAPRIGWLQHVFPEWTEGNAETIFGNEAPNGLGQLTIDLAIEGSPPNLWLLETYPDLIQDAAVRQVERSMRHMLVGMLWECQGYQIDSVVRFLEAHPTLSSNAGTQLGHLISADGINQRYIDIALGLWEALLESKMASSLEGFGWMSTATTLDTDCWAELTLLTLRKTGGHIDWEHQVADRAMSQPATTTKLALLDQLIRGQSDHWALRHLADNIQEFLSTASSLESTDEYRRLLTVLLERGMIEE